MLNAKDGPRVLLLSDLEKEAQRGISSGALQAVPPTKIDPQSVYTVMYTSGTTGNPKGVMLTHYNMMSVLNSFLTVNTEEVNPLPDGAEKVHLSYLPLAHIMERAINLMALIRGSKIGFWRGDVDGLIDDMKVIKPPMFIGVPRIFQRIQDKVSKQIQDSSFIAQWLFRTAYRRKLDAMLNRQEPSKIWDRLIFNKIKAAFGGNITFIGSGSAPLSAELAHFLKVCLAPIVGEGYGLTETSAGGTGTHEFDLKYGHVGQPRTNMQLKLVSVPEMDYRVSDEGGPRGEVWMRGSSIFKGYFKEDAKTRDVVTKDGWFKTGDIARWRPEGRLEIVDRKNNIFKLSQGEYIRPEFIQNVYGASRFETNIFVDGNSSQNYLVAIIVPDMEALQQYFDSVNDGPGKGLKVEAVSDMNENKEIMRVIQEDMAALAVRAKLNGFEKVKKFRLKKEEFSAENGLLTISMKLKRNVARKRFEKEIAEMYRKR